MGQYPENHKIPVKLVPDWVIWGNMMAKPLIRGIRTFSLENTPRETSPQDLCTGISSFPAPFWGPIGAHRGLGPKSWPEIMKTKKIGHALKFHLVAVSRRDLI